MFENIKYFYKHFGWTKEQVHDAVGMGWITEDQYQSITDEEQKDRR